MNLSVICTLCNRWDQFAKMMESLRHILLHDDEVIVVDYKSDDIPIFAGRSHRLRMFTRRRPFRRAQGLNFGASMARQHPGQVLFFTDADMLYPKNFRDLLEEHVVSGKAFFPICEDLDEEGEPVGEYGMRTGGFGICAFTATDFHRLTGWDETFTAWGREDNDLYKRAKDMVRARMVIPGLYHQWHPTEEEYLNRYYKEKP